MNYFRRIRFFFFAMLIFILMSFVFFSCRKNDSVEDDSSKQIILGFSQIGAESAWRNQNSFSIQTAAEEAGIQLLFTNAEQKQENQIRAIRSFIAYQVDVIAFVPIVTTGWENVLREAKDAGIPVLVTDRKIDIQDESLYAGFIGTDSVQAGRKAGLFLLDKYRNTNASAENPIRIVELTGNVGSSVAIGRGIGFREIIGNDPRFEIIYSESGDFLRSKGYELMQSVLETHENIDVIYSHNDSMSLGAIVAMKEKGINPGNDITIITIDAEQAAIDALQRGEVNCVIECNPKTGHEIMKLVTSLANGEGISREIYVEEKVFREDDDLSNIEQRGY
jgi:simple sugar transport system substrate-binding protein